VSTNHYRVVLGFDYGTKRIGVAVGQELTQTATPLTTLGNVNHQPDWSAIEQLINEWRPDAFIVGLPTTADGTEQAMQRAVKRFGNQLHQRYNIVTHWVDERLTSQEAERMIAHPIHSQAKNPAKRMNKARATKKNPTNKAEIDKIAAKLIVESWLGQQP